jgi:hypothetical protein
MNPASSGYQRMISTRSGQQVPAVPQPTPPSPGQQPSQALIQQQSAPTEKALTPDEQAILRELEQAARPK